MNKHPSAAAGLYQRASASMRMLFRLEERPRSKYMVVIVFVTLACTSLALSQLSEPGQVVKNSAVYRQLDRLALNQLMEWYYGVSWPRIARRARARSKYNCTRFPTDAAAMHATIISLVRTPGRAKDLCDSLEAGGMAYTMFPAQDSLEVIPQQLVDWYTGDRMKRLLSRFPPTSAVEPATYAAFQENALPYHDREAFQQRLFFGNKVSNVRLLHRAVAEDWDHGIIFEDDAVVVPEFAQRLQEVLCDLPHDWDVLMLNACEYNVGEFVSHGARVFKNGVCTIGYVFSRKFALYLLHSPHGLVHSNYHPDSLIGHLAHLNYISAFMCDPPLVLFGDEAKTSTVFNNQVTTR